MYDIYKYMKRCLTSSIRMRHQFTFTIIAIIKRTDNNSVGEDAEKFKLLHIAGGSVQWCNSFGKSTLSVPQKVKHDPEILFLSRDPKEMENMFAQKVVHESSSQHYS